MTNKNSKVILLSLFIFLGSSPAGADRAAIKVKKIWDHENYILLHIHPPPTICEEQIIPNAMIEKLPENDNSIYEATISKMENIEVEVSFTEKSPCDHNPLSITID